MMPSESTAVSITMPGQGTILADRRGNLTFYRICPVGRTSLIQPLQQACYSLLQPPWSSWPSVVLSSVSSASVCGGPPGAWGCSGTGDPWDKLPVLTVICNGTFSHWRMQIFWKRHFKCRQLVWRSKKSRETQLIRRGFPAHLVFQLPPFGNLCIRLISQPNSFRSFLSYR